MRFDVITLFPEMLNVLKLGISGRALTNGKITLQTWNPRDFSDHPDRRIDDRPYGGGPGMVMQYAPLHKAIQAAKKASNLPSRVIYMSPQGKPLTQPVCQKTSENTEQQLIFIAGRYEGIDERLLQEDVDEEWSAGDYVLSGGELPVMLAIDAITRLIPGVLGAPESAQEDSFSDGLLDHPHYTRPAKINGHAVPDVLQSGDHQAIAAYRHQQRLIKTWQKRPDLIKRRVLTDSEKHVLKTYIKEHTDGSLK